MVLIEVIILKANFTVINVNKEKRKPGLMVNENDRSLKNMYANHDVEYLENTLTRYLNFLLWIVNTGVVTIWTKSQRSSIDWLMYNILQISHIRFSKLRRDIKLILIDIACWMILNQQYTTSNIYIMNAIIDFINNQKCTELDNEINLKIDYAWKLIDQSKTAYTTSSLKHPKLDDMYIQQMIITNNQFITQSMTKKPESGVQGNNFYLDLFWMWKYRISRC